MKTIQEIIEAWNLCKNEGENGMMCECCPYQNGIDCEVELLRDAFKSLEIAATMKDTYEALCKEMYEEGMRKAWDIATRIAFVGKDGAFTCKEFNEIFDNKNKGAVFQMTPQEVMKMIEDWEKKKEEKQFKVGDVVRYIGPEDVDELKGIVVEVLTEKPGIRVIWNQFGLLVESPDVLEKTGNIIDFKTL